MCEVANEAYDTPGRLNEETRVVKAFTEQELAERFYPVDLDGKGTILIDGKRVRFSRSHGKQRAANLIYQDYRLPTYYGQTRVGVNNWRTTHSEADIEMAITEALQKQMGRRAWTSTRGTLRRIRSDERRRSTRRRRTTTGELYKRGTL